MNKKSIFTTVVIAIVGLAVFAYINLKSQTTEVSMEVRHEASFSQKQECASYRNEIESRISDEYIWSDSAGSAHSELDEVWYSISRNSCLYSFKQQRFYSYDKSTVNSYSIYDYLQNTTLLDINDSSNPKAFVLFEQKKEELR